MSVLVIIPHYDLLNHLHRPLDAVANADVDARALIVDNETSAEARDIAASYPADVTTRVQQSPAENRNVGIQKARLQKDHEFVCFLDADDSFARGSLAARRDALAETGADVAVCPTKHIYADGSKEIRETVTGSWGSHIQLFRGEREVTVHAPLVRSDVIERHEFDEDYPRCEDWHYWVRVLAEESVVAVDGPPVEYHHHDGQRSMQDPEERYLDKHRAARDLVARYPELEEWARQRERDDWYCAGRLALEQGDIETAARMARRSLAASGRQVKAWALLAATRLGGDRTMRQLERVSTR